MSLVCFKIQPTRANIQEFDVHTYNNFDHLLMAVSEAIHENRPILIYGRKSRSHKTEEMPRILIGNEQVAKKTIKVQNSRNASTSSSSRNIQKLHLHHVIFKDMRESLPGINYVCFQTPTEHHRQYHRHLKELRIKYNNFTTINSYLNQIRDHTVKASMKEKDNYSDICRFGANIAMYAQQQYIQITYSWLNMINSSRYLMIAHRLIAPTTFPNNILANKTLCERKHRQIEQERNLSHFIARTIERNNSLNAEARHLRKILEAKIGVMNLYTERDTRNITEQEAIDIANNNHSRCEQLYKPKLKINDSDSETSSIASSFDSVE